MLGQLIGGSQHLIEKDVVAGFGGRVMLDSQVRGGQDVQHVVLLLEREGLDGLLREVLLERVVVVGL